MTIDEQHMRRALDLARAGVGLVSPNPAVGAVVVDASGREVGAGTHTYDGVKHAEVLALEQAGNAARGGTLYLNLEPCSHQGRTGPCADAVIAAGIRRVICSMEDPNPRVAGQGFAKLRASGIKVEVGLFQAEAKKLNESFAKYIRLRQTAGHTEIGHDPRRENRRRHQTGRGTQSEPLGHACDRRRAQRIPLDHRRSGARARAATAPSE